MNLAFKTGLGAAFLTLWSASAAHAEGLHFAGDLATNYPYIPLGVLVTDLPVIQPSVTLDLPQEASLMIWGSTTMQDLGRPAHNAGSEADALLTCPKIGPFSCAIGYNVYGDGTEDGYLRGSMDMPLDFTFTYERLNGVSKATSYGLASPAYELGAVSLKASVNYTQIQQDERAGTENDEFGVVAGSATYPISDVWIIKGQAFKTFGKEFNGSKEDVTAGTLTLSFHY